MSEKNKFENRSFSFEVECTEDGAYHLLKLIKEFLDENYLAWNNLKTQKI